MHTAVVEKRYELNRKYREKRQEIINEERKDLTALQKECGEIGHVWRQKPVDNGKCCEICGFEGDEDD